MSVTAAYKCYVPLLLGGQESNVAKWTGHWTQVQKIWGSIPSVGHV